VLHSPALADLAAQVKAWQPTLLYVHAGVAGGGQKINIETQALAPLPFLHNGADGAPPLCTQRAPATGAG
jgi:hypothetical protein